MPAAEPSLSLASETTLWGDAPRPFVIATHATGFCKEVYRPVIDELRRDVTALEVLAFDARAHGDSDAPEPPYDWWDYGRDVLALTAGRRGIAGVGHSGGAAALVFAELLDPGTFASMVLVEPIVFPGPYGRIDHPLTEAALKRKPTFASPLAALENFADKPAFAAWEPAALEAYIAGGLAPVGDHWRLKCSPEHEAEWYRGATDHGAWERLGEIASDVVLVVGERSDSHSEDFAAEMADRIGEAHVDVVQGAGHFVTMEDPARIASHVARHVAGESGQLIAQR